MVLGNHKNPIKAKSLDRPRSMVKVPSTSKIPKDFFRKPIDNKSYPQPHRPPNSLEFTFMPNKEKGEERRGVKRVGLVRYEGRGKINE